MNGTIFNIQKFCTSDGPGIRTNVFLKGCPLRCAWCHNPESQNIRPELLYYADKCVSCLRCLPLCRTGAQTVKDRRHFLDREKCVTCFECVGTGCDALARVGKNMSVDEVMDEVIKDKAFYDASGGGMTLSGGEPLWQGVFAAELLGAAKRAGINNCVETCGFVKRGTLKDVLPLVDTFLFDIKLTDDETHRKYTGVPFGPILENLRFIDSMGADIVLRCPIIPGVNDNPEHFERVAEIADETRGVTGIDIEPYHPLGTSKCAGLGRSYAMKDTEFPTPEESDRWVEEMSGMCRKTVRKA